MRMLTVRSRGIVRPWLMRQRLRVVALTAALLLLLQLTYWPALRHTPPPPADPLQPSALRVDPIPGWGPNRSRDLRLYVKPDAATTLMEPSWSCGERSPFLLVIVYSALENARMRLAIRDTWGGVRAVSNASVYCAFLIGTPAPGPMAYPLQADLELESAIYGDLIQENFVDSYHNLTLKTAFLLKWVRSQCTGARFVYKVDDDMFVNMDSLVMLLLAIQRGRAEASGGRVALPGTKNRPSLAPGPLLLGDLICGSQPITNASHKWYAPRYMYSDSVYPNFLSGTSYVLSSDAIGPLYSVALRTPFFHLEDVFLTGLCARQAGLRPRDHPGFTHLQREPDACVLGDESNIASHLMDESTLRQVWAAIQEPYLNCTPADVPTPTKKNMEKKIQVLRRKISGAWGPEFRCV